MRASKPNAAPRAAPIQTDALRVCVARVADRQVGETAVVLVFAVRSGAVCGRSAFDVDDADVGKIGADKHSGRVSPALKPAC